MRKMAHVHFVGAGPGNPELLTLRAARLLNEADTVLYDALVGPEILKMIRSGARRISVGKRAGCHSMGQSEINRRLVAEARRGGRVIRLKGGDPAIFGRLEEEVEALSAHGIGYDICPGITAASAAAASVGVPLTLRGKVRGVRFLTTASCPEEPNDPAWGRLAGGEETLAFYMARSALVRIARRLAAAGMSSFMPVLIVEAVSMPQERIRAATLAEVGAGALTADPAQPVLLMIGHALGAHAQKRLTRAPALSDCA